MKFLWTVILFFTLILFACSGDAEISSMNSNKWKQHTVTSEKLDSLKSGTTYLAVYSQIYKESENRIQDLTATVSIRNLNPKDTIYISSAKYYNSSGKLVRAYLKKPIYLMPLETVEIVIDQKDKDGGTGANFIFKWHTKPGIFAPEFDAVMISVHEGISFTTQGKRLN